MFDGAGWVEWEGKSGGLTEAEQPRTWSYKPEAGLQKVLVIQRTSIEMGLYPGMNKWGTER